MSKKRILTIQLSRWKDSIIVEWLIMKTAIRKRYVSKNPHLKNQYVLATNGKLLDLIDSFILKDYYSLKKGRF
jgi:hypothetical protein